MALGASTRTAKTVRGLLQGIKENSLLDVKELGLLHERRAILLVVQRNSLVNCSNLGTVTTGISVGSLMREMLHLHQPLLQKDHSVGRTAQRQMLSD